VSTARSAQFYTFLRFFCTFFSLWGQTLDFFRALGYNNVIMSNILQKMYQNNTIFLAQNVL